jgi:hypothetical protein
MKNTAQFQLIQQTAPHIAEKMELFWGTQYFSEYVNILMVNTGNGREKLDQNVFNAIYELLKQHEKLHPRDVKTNVWDGYYKW